MFRQCVSLLLAWTLLTSTAATAASQQPPQKSIQAQILAIPAGTLIEVRTAEKQKYRGRLGEATGAAFTMQVERNGKTEALTIDYKSAKSVKTIPVATKSGQTATWIVLASAAAVATVLLVLIGLRASNE